MEFDFGRVFLIFILQMIVIMIAENRGKEKAIRNTFLTNENLFKTLGGKNGIENFYDEYIKKFEDPELKDMATIIYNKMIVGLFMTNLAKKKTTMRNSMLIKATTVSFTTIISILEDAKECDDYETKENMMKEVKDTLYGMNKSLDKLLVEIDKGLNDEESKGENSENENKEKEEIKE